MQCQYYNIAAGWQQVASQCLENDACARRNSRLCCQRPGHWKPGSRTRASQCFEGGACGAKNGCLEPGHWEPGSRTRASECRVV